MVVKLTEQFIRMEAACGSLIDQLQIIWDEVGEADEERDKMLLELEQECMDVYRRKVDHANNSKVQLQKDISNHEAEVEAICIAMGEPPVQFRQTNETCINLKQEMKLRLHHLEEMQRRKSERCDRFLHILEQIQDISNEIRSDNNSSNIIIDISDISIARLGELHKELKMLQQEKANRVKLVLDYINTISSLCLVLGKDFKQVLREIHPRLGLSEVPGSISDRTIKKLNAAMEKLRDIKIERMQKLQGLATSLLQLWHLMDTPIEEQRSFHRVTSKIAASEDEITDPSSLSVEFINLVENEVSRLEQIKGSKMKELLLRKMSELKEIHTKSHISQEPDAHIDIPFEAIESGAIDSYLVMEQIDAQLANVKDEAFSRKEILEKVEKWLSACNEESWLEDYNMDENRFTGKGAHLTLKRAEKARMTVSKLPGMVETLVAKTTEWEQQKGVEFKYDGVGLLDMLEEYTNLKQEKDQERRKQRDQRKIQIQLEQEVVLNPKPGTPKGQPLKRVLPSKITKTDLLQSSKSPRAIRKANEGPSPPTGAVIKGRVNAW